MALEFGETFFGCGNFYLAHSQKYLKTTGLCHVIFYRLRLRPSKLIAKIDEPIV